MEYRSLGRSGLTVSTIGLGLNNLGRPGTVTEVQEGATAVVVAAIDAGITLLDTADIYGGRPGLSETLLGVALKGRRDDVVLATKWGHQGVDVGRPSWGGKGGRSYVRRAVEASLTRLQTDWIDLYQLHTPDPHTPIEETLAVLDDLITEGKVRYIGHSNFAGWQIAEADLTATLHSHPHFVSGQDEYSLINRSAEREILPATRAFGLGFLPFFPLYNGLLTGKFTRDGGPENSRIMRQRPHLLETAPWEAIERYRTWCADNGVEMVTASFGWLLAQPALSSVIAGATTPEQIVQNAAASDWRPTDTQIAEISEIFATP